MNKYLIYLIWLGLLLMLYGTILLMLDCIFYATLSNPTVFLFTEISPGIIIVGAFFTGLSGVIYKTK